MSDLMEKGRDRERRAEGLWRDRWARFAAGMLRDGVLSERRKFLEGWVRKFIGWVKPRRGGQVERSDIENFFALLLQEGKKEWQVWQASEALQVFL